ncbi:ectoine hydroxylase [Marinobacterium jannaschii]|uniref:ectoine hydroxylase n=1 Tax=Marinobacterium jannaschii TaxID=64970 RepID=UPI0004866C69|nr:ectoine hydroxylase [Marinobacterium jannaschii]
MSASDHNSTGREDHYPSRQGAAAHFVERRDPTIHAPLLNHGPLSSQQLASYSENGFLILDQLFAAQELEQLQQELARLRDDSQLRQSPEAITEPDSGELRSLFRIHQSSDRFRQLAQDPRLAEIARFLLNDEVYIHQSRLNYKPGFRGKEFYWHSDFETWHVEDGMPRMRALSMSITLTENLPHNGSLMLIPGSHRLFAACEGQTPENHYEKSLKKQEYGVPSDSQLQQLAQRGGIVTATCKPGSVIIFDCNVMHGSNSNISPDPRSNLFFVYNALSNRVQAPFCDRPARPEHICSRSTITALRRTD